MDPTQKLSDPWASSVMVHREKLFAAWLKDSGYTPYNTVLCESTVVEEDGSVVTKVWFEKREQ